MFSWRVIDNELAQPKQAIIYQRNINKCFGMDDIHRERLQATKFVENNKSISLDFAFERQPENE